MAKAKVFGISAGTYPARVGFIDVVSGDYGNQLKWRFCVFLPDGAGAELKTAWSSWKEPLHPSSKAAAWAAALTGQKLANGMEVDTDKLQNLPCLVSIVENEGVDNEGKKRQFMNVDAVLALPAGATVPEVPEGFDWESRKEKGDKKEPPEFTSDDDDVPF